MELDNAMDEEEINRKGIWVPGTPAKQNPTSIYNGVDSHLGLAKTAQFSQIFQNPHALASEKETHRSDRGIGNLNSFNSGSDHDFAGLYGTSAKATSEGKIGELSDNRPYKEKIKVGEGGESHNENTQSTFGLDSTVTSTIPENQRSEKRSNSGIDLDEKSRKRQRMKRHRPKIWDESKPRKIPKSRIEPSTPKPKTPRRRVPTSSTNQKYVRKDSGKVDASIYNDGQSTNRRSLCAEKPCKKVLRFNLENHIIDQKDVEGAVTFTDEHNHYDSKDDEFLGISMQNIHKQAIYPNPNCAAKSSINLANEESRIQSRDSFGKMSGQATNLNPEQRESLCKETLNLAHSRPLMDGIIVYQRRNKSLSTHLCKLDFNLNLEQKDFDDCFELRNIVHEYNRSGGKRLHKSAYNCETNANLETENQNTCDEMKIEPEVDLNLQSCCRSDSFKVYRRILKPNECLKNSRKIGPNCPRIYKKTRMQRRKATTSSGFWNATTVDQCQRCKKGMTLSYGASKTIKKTGKQHLSRRLTQKEALVRDKNTQRRSKSAIRKGDFPVQLGQRGITPLTRKQKSKTKRDPCVLNIWITWGHRRKRSKRLNRRQKLAFSIVPFHMPSQNKDVVHPGPLRYFPHEATSYHDNIRQCPSQSKNGLIEIPVGYQKQEDVMLKSVHYQENVALDRRGRHKVPKRVLQIKDDNAYMQAVLENTIDCLERLHISEKCNQLVVLDKKTHGELIPYKGKVDPPKTRKPPAKVDFDKKTLIAWKQLMENDGSGATEEADKDAEKWWEDVRKMYRERANSLIARMHLILGDRRFSRWKGTIVDSIIGVFLTQNVSDCLSSSAFMSLVASFPPVRTDANCKENIVCDQKSVGSNIEEPGVPENKEQAYVYPVEKDKDMGYQSAEIRESHIGFIGGAAVPCSMEDEVIVKDVLQGFPDASCDQNLTNISASCSLDKSTTYRERLQLEEINFLEQFYDHQEGRMSSQENCEELQGMKNVFSLDTLSFNGTHASYSNAFFPRLDDKLNFIYHLRDTRNRRTEESSDISNLDRRNYFESETIIPEEDTQRIQEQVIAEMSSSSKLHEPPAMTRKNSFHGSKSQAAGNPNDDQDRNKANKYQNGNRPESTSGRKKGKVEPETPIDWDELRKTYHEATSRDTTSPTDSANWEAVREAPVEEVAKVIETRGMNNILAGRIKDFLDRIVKDHGSIDLEWLRNVPPDKAKEYLLSIPGLGLKSVECVRLLTLHHVAFPVDTNVGRIVVRLGWVPLQPLPEDVQIHLLNQYPMVDAIQKYLWPRLCTLDQQTLYELHYQLITFGKVFCTKKTPNCNACPMKGECRHFASAFASARLRLPGPEEKNVIISESPVPAGQDSVMQRSPILLPVSDGDFSEVRYEYNNCEPIIEVPASPEPSSSETLVRDIEDFGCESEDEIPTIRLDAEELKETLKNFMEKTSFLHPGSENSKALVAISPKAASIPNPKLKKVDRLRTVHQVYELPDSHPLLAEFEKREADDPCPYLLRIWTTDEMASSSQQSGKTGDAQDAAPCNASACFSGNTDQEQNEKTVKGTILIPCRTATRGTFPLNGTYFQVNEVFADHITSLCPIAVPREWIWRLPRRSLYCGTGATSIFKGMSAEEIQYCFWRGFVCVRGVDRVSRDAKQLSTKFHPHPQNSKTKHAGDK